MVDGSEIRRSPVDMVNIPVIYKVLYKPGAAGFLPSTVVSYFLTPRKLGKIPILTNIVQRAWNHQLANMELKHRVLFQMIFLFNPFHMCDLFGFHMNFPREAQFSVVPLEYSRRFFVDSKVFSNTAKLWECRALRNRPWEIYSTWNTDANTALMFEMKFLFQFFWGFYVNFPGWTSFSVVPCWVLQHAVMSHHHFLCGNPRSYTAAWTPSIYSLWTSNLGRFGG